MQSLLGSSNQTLVSTFRNMIKNEGVGRLVNRYFVCVRIFAENIDFKNCIMKTLLKWFLGRSEGLELWLLELVLLMLATLLHMNMRKKWCQIGFHSTISPVMVRATYHKIIIFISILVSECVILIVYYYYSNGYFSCGRCYSNSDPRRHFESNGGDKTAIADV